jgi:hypothetical protein
MQLTTQANGWAPGVGHVIVLGDGVTLTVRKARNRKHAERVANKIVEAVEFVNHMSRLTTREDTENMSDDELLDEYVAFRDMIHAARSITNG